MSNSTMSYDLPLFPLNTVLFPTNKLPLRIFETRYVDLVGRCMRESAPFGVIGIAEGHETGTPATTFELGTQATIIDFDQGSDGLLNIVIVGGERFRLESADAGDDNLLVGQVNSLAPVAETRIPDEYLPLVELLGGVQSNPEAPPIDTPKDAAGLAYTIAQFLPITTAEKVELLGLDDPVELLARIADVIAGMQQQQSP